MRNICIFIISFIIFNSCEQKKHNGLYLSYEKDNTDLFVLFKNNTNQDVIFLIPNSLEFGDENYKSLSTRGSMESDYPLNVFAVIKNGQTSNPYQKKLDSISNSYLREIGNASFIQDKRPGDGNSVIYLKSKEERKIKYDLIIKAIAVQSKKNYSSTFKQNYYPYNKIIKGKYPEGEDIRRFSRLKFGNAQFIAQPIIEDTLVLKLSEEDVTN